jgi:tryptophanyl-tRNA synthetase
MRKSKRQTSVQKEFANKFTDNFTLKLNPITGAIEYINENEPETNIQTVPDKLKDYVEFFRKLPKDIKIQSLWEHYYKKEYPCGPLEMRIICAGANISEVLRLECFKKDKDELLNTYNEGRQKSMETGNTMLWREMRMNLRARALLPYSCNYFKTFEKDCQLVANELEQEAQYLTGEQKNKGMSAVQKEKMSKSARALAVLKDHPDWTNKKIAEAAGIHPKSLSRNKDFCKAREILKSGKSTIPNGRKDPETGNVEAW